MLALLALALALRFYRLDGQSLWADEGTSVALALRSLPQIARDAARDIHPPLYYLLLHFWVRILGTSEVAVRSFSALLGTLLVLATYRLGTQLFDRRLGLVAALIAAFSPFQIYYSQETRMYILTTLLGAISFIALIEVLGKQNSRSPTAWYAAYLLTTIAMLYTHYSAATLLIAQNGVWLLALAHGRPSRKRRAWGEWLGGQALIAVAFLPWLWYARDSLQAWPDISPRFGLAFLLGDVWRVFSLGLSVPRSFHPALIGFGLLAALGLVAIAAWPRRRLRELPHRGTVVALYLAVPILLTYVASLRRPAYNPKFLLLATPPYHLLLAAGVLAWRERARGDTGRPLHNLWTALTLGFILIASTFSLRNYFFDSQYARDDYRALVRYVEAVAGSDDALLINAPGQVEIVDYYARGLVPEYAIPQRRPPDRGETEAALNELAAKHRHIYAVLWATEQSDPDGIVSGWLAENTYPASEVWYGNVRLAMYAIPKSTSGEMQPVGVDFEDHVRLRSYALQPSAVAAGDVLQLSLQWESLANLDRRYKAFTHLLDPEDHIVGQRDAEPLAGLRPTTGWRAGEEIVDHYGLPVFWGTPPGTYRLEVGLYDAETGARLATAAGDRVLLGDVRVTRPPAWPPLSALPVQHRADAMVAGLRLRGWDLTRLGSGSPLDGPVHAGEPLMLVIFWQRGETLAGETLSLQVDLIAGEQAASWVIEPVGGRYPPVEWAAEEIVRDPHTLFLPDGLPAGRYTLRLAGAGSAAGESYALRLGGLVIQ